MVYLEFGEKYVRLKDKSGALLWENVPRGMHRCTFCGTLSKTSEGLCFQCGGPWSPAPIRTRKQKMALWQHRGIVECGRWLVANLQGGRMPFPDGTRILGQGIREQFMDDVIEVMVGHPDLDYVAEGCAAMTYCPTFIDADDGTVRFESWGNANG